uniref:Diphosphomevalonate decarboxylase n=1 Tax=Phallusia mammillata TaxID=59560 RepID=A0A6F9DLN1_9ASCI|nr:diphosphomevalonate decarboxylase-like [Phallusia mammillata]
MQEEHEIEMVTCSAPVNIAVIKYWGKSCEKKNIPLNSSISLTLNQDHLKATTTVATSKGFESDKVWLNGVKQDVVNNARLQACLNEIRSWARKQAARRKADAKELLKISQKIHIASQNNFPTAAGLASSAAGYAALVFALGQLFSIEGDLTRIARRGSGSACRSMDGGFVEWIAGTDEDDSIAKQFVPEMHWPELRVFIIVVSKKKKDIGSTGGMKNSVETSSLLQYRVSDVVPHRLTAVKTAILEHDFSAFAEICMKESNQLHAVCQDTYPPLLYMNDTSKEIVKLVHKYNDFYGSTRLAYTFDAGPNAFLFTLDPFANEVATILNETFGFNSGDKFFRGLSVKANEPLPYECGTLEKSVEYVICTNPGKGPKVVMDETLLSNKSGLPIFN